MGQRYKKLKRSDFTEFGNPNYKNLTMEITLTSWGEFHGVVKKFENLNSYIWRGQKEQFKLNATVDRGSSGGREDLCKQIFSDFRKILSRHRNIKALKGDQIWAIGQHYGLEKTPLLDWTESPYIAAYFAFYEKDENAAKPAVVYALNKGLELLLNGKGQRYVEFDLAVNKFDHPINQRLVNQEGRFTKALDGRDVESVLSKFYKTAEKKGKYKNEVFLLKTYIRVSTKRTV